MRKRLICIISGRVQGVLYRAFTKEVASKLHIKGEVQNLSDGTVRVEAEGDEKQLIEFQMMPNKGSAFSRVDNVICDVYENLLDHKEFNIKYRSFFDRF